MRCPRLTTRWIMALIAVLAVGLGLGLPAAEVAGDRRAHDHVWLMTDEEARAAGMSPPYCGEALMQSREVAGSSF